MIKRYRNHTLQTNRPHIEEEPQITNSHKTRHTTLKRQLKYSKQLYLPRQDDCKTKIVNEYDQEIPLSQTADKPVAP